MGEADNGQDAVELAARLQPSIILMDINIPKMKGIEATTRIKTRWPQMLVFGLSVNASEDNPGTMKQAGATRIMTKEAAVDELHGAIQEALKVSVSTLPYPCFFFHYMARWLGVTKGFSASLNGSGS